MESHRSSSLMPPLPLLFLEICVRCNLQRRLLDSYESLLPTTRESFRPLTEGRPSFPCARRQLMRRTRALEKGHILRFAGRRRLSCCHCIAWHWPYRTSGLPRQALGGNRVGSICQLNYLRCHNVLHLFYSVPLHTCSHTVIWCDLAWHDLKWCEEDTSLSTMQAADLRRPAMKHHETICEFILYHPTRPTTMINYLLRSLLQSVNIIQYL